jgi:hypothetical protein
MVEISKPRIVVLNPANPQEDVSERWQDPAHYGAFVAGIRDLHARWTSAMTATGIPNVASALEVLLGEPVPVAVKKQASAVQELRESSKLHTTPRGLIAVGPAVGTALRSNTFHSR